MQRISFGDNFILTQMDKPVPYEKCELFFDKGCSDQREEEGID